MTRCKCIRCGYKWEARVRKPVQCPMCKSMRWNIPKRIKGD